MKYANAKRSIVLNGRKTSVSLEDPFWIGLNQIANERGKSISAVVTKIKNDRENFGNTNLSSAIRIFVFEHYRDKHAPDSPRGDAEQTRRPGGAH